MKIEDMDDFLKNLEAEIMQPSWFPADDESFDEDLTILELTPAPVSSQQEFADKFDFHSISDHQKDPNDRSFSITDQPQLIPIMGGDLSSSLNVGSHTTAHSNGEETATIQLDPNPIQRPGQQDNDYLVSIQPHLSNNLAHDSSSQVSQIVNFQSSQPSKDTVDASRLTAKDVEVTISRSELQLAQTQACHDQLINSGLHGKQILNDSYVEETIWIAEDIAFDGAEVMNPQAPDAMEIDHFLDGLLQSVGSDSHLQSTYELLRIPDEDNQSIRGDLEVREDAPTAGQADSQPDAVSNEDTADQEIFDPKDGNDDGDDGDDADSVLTEVLDIEMLSPSSTAAPSNAVVPVTVRLSQVRIPINRVTAPADFVHTETANGELMTRPVPNHQYGTRTKRIFRPITIPSGWTIAPGTDGREIQKEMAEQTGRGWAYHTTKPLPDDGEKDIM